MKKLDMKKPNSIMILSAAVGTITLVIGITFIYMPFLNKNRSLRAEILKERDKNVLIGTIRALNKYAKVYNKIMPQGRGVSWLLKEVSTMAAKEQIEITSVKPGAPSDRGLYTDIYIVMETISTHDQLGKFISSIEASEKFLKIESIEIRRLDADGQSAADMKKFESFDVKARIVISTVVFKE